MCCLFEQWINNSNAIKSHNAVVFLGFSSQIISIIKIIKSGFSAEDNFLVGGFPADLDGEIGTLGSENCDVLRSLSQDVDNSIVEPSKFNSSVGKI